MKIKREFSMLLAAILLFCTLLPISAQAFDENDFTNSSWYGKYTTTFHGQDTTLDIYLDFTIQECDLKGNFTGISKIRTVEGQGYDGWWTLKTKGIIDFDANSFYMEEVEQIDGTSMWYFDSYQGEIEANINGDMNITGDVDTNGGKKHPFSVSRTSEWARDEMTEANILGLIPETMKNADMSKRITRAEFAAVAVKLYESLTGENAVAGSTPLADINGNRDKTSIEKAYHLGIAVGTSDTTFEPNVALNREQLATMLCRTIKKYSFDGWTLANDDQYYLDTSGVATFADDANISAYAKPSVYYMAKMGIIKGVDDMHFAPKNVTPEQEAQGYAVATREQAIALSLRIYKLSDLWR